ncbi:K02A2.6-like [Cordylochernes scorpioides]|uniref:RNA-directed DNA polymerase n=1 Tax=Cordylochernes scorpioides TaxID=51811 RepID=A0ABY6LSE3_9ARAC|nr:K02A2.6-like [Cordylochernes scorpioides]
MGSEEGAKASDGVLAGRAAEVAGADDCIAGRLLASFGGEAVVFEALQQVGDEDHWRNYESDYRILQDRLRESLRELGKLWQITRVYDLKEDDFEIFIQRFNAACTANETSEHKKVVILLSLLDSGLLKLGNDLFFPEKMEAQTYELIRENETVSEYLRELKHLASNCTFGKMLEMMLRDRFVAGLTSESLQKRLLQEDDEVKLERVFALAVSYELAEKDAKELHEKEVARVTSHIERSRNSKCSPTKENFTTATKERTCYRCGMKNPHLAPACPQKFKTFYKCKRIAEYLSLRGGTEVEIALTVDGKIVNGIVDTGSPVELTDEAKRVVHINTTKGLFAYRILPNGVAVAPNKFKRLMDNAFADIPGVACYIDDILVSGKAARDHKSKLELVFNKLEEKGLKLNKAKCKFAVDSVEYLGFPKELVLACDASSYGLGVVLSHRYKKQESPIAFASRTLTEAEKHYSQLEKEALSIVYGCEKFRQYLLGRSFVLVTDNRPLMHLFSPHKLIPLCAASRIKRWSLKLGAFHYSVEFRKTEDHGNADALSRLLLKANEGGTYDDDQILLLRKMNEVPFSFQDVAFETKRDKTLAIVLRNVREDIWQSPKFTKENPLSPYYKVRNELSVDFGCLQWKERIVIPPELRSQILIDLHETHFGMVKMKIIARRYFWRPGIVRSIEDMARQCTICQESADMPPSMITEWTWPEKPWHRLHPDLAGPFISRMFLVIVDAYTKWLEIFILRDITMTDNGRQFVSREMEEFTRNGIRHTKTSPYNPSTNGLAERAFPQSVLKESPAELLMKRRLKSRFSNLMPKMDMKGEGFPDALKKQEHFKIGSVIYFRNYAAGPKWKIGTILKLLSCRHYLIGYEGQSLKRHINQLRPVKENREATVEKEPSLVLPSTSGQGLRRESHCEREPSHGGLEIPEEEFTSNELEPQSTRQELTSVGEHQKPMTAASGEKSQAGAPDPRDPGDRQTSMKKTRSNNTMIEQTHNQVPQEPTTDSTVAASLRTLTLCLDQLLNSRQARKALSSLRGEPRKIAQDLALLNKTYEEVKESLCAVYPRRPSFTLQEFCELKCTSMAEIETYYKNKVRIGLAINLPKSAIVQALSNGVPPLKLPKNDHRARAEHLPPPWTRPHHILAVTVADNTGTHSVSSEGPTSGPFGPLHLRSTASSNPKDRLGLQVSTRPQQRRAREKPSNASFGSRTPPKLNEPTCTLNQHTPVISLRPYRTPYAYQKEIQDQISQLLKHDIITPSSSPYSSPVTLVRKRDNTMRLCIDFRRVNELVPSDLHPLPLIETVLDNLSKARVFSTVDISNAYYQIPIAEESQQLLSFVYCDASTQGIAGVLKQVHPDGNIYPVQNYSRALRSYERNYTISELECLAIVECVDKFRVYLLGTRFVSYSDHHASQWLKTIKDPTGRLFRWSLRLSTYDYEVKYLKGSRQYEADLLSRNPFCGFLSTGQIKDHQGELRRDTRYILNDKDLMTITRRGVTKIIVPPSLRGTLLQRAHRDFNHPGISQMTRLIAAQYYWDGMTNDIRTHVRTCSVCQLVKPPKGPIYGELGQLPPAVLPYELVSLDTISGFAKYGNSQTSLHVVVDHATRYAWAFTSRSTSILTYTQANGLSERLNATITGKLKLLRLQQPKTAWTKLLPQVLQAYNHTPHSVTGFPPSYLLLGGFPLQLSEHAQNCPKIDDARELAYQRTHERHLRDKARFDQTHRASDFEVGDLVLTKTYHHPDTGKLTPFFSGPYEILEIISPQIVRINRSNRPLSRETDTIHVNKLKHYTENEQFISPPGNAMEECEQREEESHTHDEILKGFGGVFSMMIEGVLPWHGGRTWTDLVLGEVCSRFNSVVGDHFFRIKVQKLARKGRMTEVRDDYFADALTNMQPHYEDLVGRLTDAILGTSRASCGGSPHLLFRRIPRNKQPSSIQPSPEINSSQHQPFQVQMFFVNRQIELHPFPARSPDLSPIENMWSMVAQLKNTSLAATPDKPSQRVEAA